MKSIDRLRKYNQDNEEFDRILIHIRNGTIKCGRYAHHVKIDPDKKMKGKEFFTDEDKKA